MASNGEVWGWLSRFLALLRYLLASVVSLALSVATAGMPVPFATLSLRTGTHRGLGPMLAKCSRSAISDFHRSMICS
jgi:hypothetical protein